jgi:hypothetical protein
MSRLTCTLARLVPPTPTSEDDLRSMRAAAWHKQGVLAVPLESVTDHWERTLLEAIGNRLYGRRQVPSTGGRRDER